MAVDRRAYVRPLDLKAGRVEMTHGSGGRAMAQLIEELFLRALDNPWLQRLNDQAALDISGGRVVVSTDSHVVSPLFFPGGDIGRLSVHLFTGQFELDNVVIEGLAPNDRPFLQARRITVSLPWWCCQHA